MHDLGGSALAARFGPPWLVRTVLSVVALAALAAFMFGRPGDAAAAPCAAGLTVAGVPVTGNDCIVLGNGDIEIDQPRLLTSGAVQIQGKLILSLDRSLLTQKAGLGVSVLGVVDSGGTFRPFAAGTVSVGNFEICDALTATGQAGASTIAIDASAPSTSDRADIQRAQINCRQAPGIDLTGGVLRIAEKLLGLTPQNLSIFALENGVAVALPTRFGLDDTRGGRVFGPLTARVPLVGDRSFLIGLIVELSKSEGFKPIALSADYAAKIPIIPGVNLLNPSVTINPVDRVFGARAGLTFTPKLFAAGAEFLVNNGQLQRIGFDIGLPPPGFPVGAPPLITIQSIGFSIDRTGSVSSKAVGTTVSAPTVFKGRTSFTAGPTIPLPGGSFSAIVGDVDLTIAGPVLQITGTLTGLNKLITLGTARVLVAANPFRFEAEATVKFPSPAAAVFDGQVFIGVTGSAFTGLGTVVIQIPQQVPFIGGQRLGGFSAVVSNKAVAGVIFVDPPLLKPRSIGAAFKFQGGFEIIDSITPFITVQPSATLARTLAGGGGRALFGAEGAGFEIAPNTTDIAVQVKGAGAKPTGVAITGPDGKKIATAPLASTDAASVFLAIAKPKPGRYTVTGNGVAEVVVATLDDPAFLDPRAGYGTRPQGPVTAGTKVPVCWDVKNPPANAVVDLFEDTNGFAATGRDLATGLPPSGCFEIDTTGLEPGRHWAYGQVRVGDTPLSLRYWPIGIVIVDPARLAAPKGVKAKPTLDGATISWKKVDGATGYYVTATPVDPQDAPVLKQVSDVNATSLELSLRGAARWTVAVQAISSDATLGNVSASVVTGALTPVVLAGSPNGTPQVGQPWAFQLETANLKSIRLLASPVGTKLNRRTGLLTWTPSAKAGRVAPQLLKVQGCAAKPKRCVTQEWHLSAYGVGFSPAGPARGFKVLDSVVEPGDVLEIRAQGIDESVTVKVDGKRLRATILDQATVSVVLPGNLKQGPHDVSFRIGKDLEETLTGAIVVL